MDSRFRSAPARCGAAWANTDTDSLINSPLSETICHQFALCVQKALIVSLCQLITHNYAALNPNAELFPRDLVSPAQRLCEAQRSTFSHNEKETAGYICIKKNQGVLTSISMEKCSVCIAGSAGNRCYDYHTHAHARAPSLTWDADIGANTECGKQTRPVLIVILLLLSDFWEHNTNISGAPTTQDLGKMWHRWLFTCFPNTIIMFLGGSHETGQHPKVTCCS